MTQSKEVLADEFLEHEGQGGFKPAFVRKAFLAGFTAAEARYKEALSKLPRDTPRNEMF